MRGENRFNIISKTDDLPLSVLTVEPEGEIKCVVQLVHGMCEYKERYLEFMHYLADNGCFCVIHDHRGHGASVKDAGDLGYFYEGGYRGLINDCAQITNEMKMRLRGMYPGKAIPYILLGHSMGSFAVRCFAKLYDDKIDKLIVVGSPSKISGSSLGIALSKVMGIGSRGKKHSRLLDYMCVEGMYEKRYKKEGRHAWVCADPGVVEKYNNDPLCNYTFTIQGYTQLLYLMKETYSTKGWKMKNPSLPIRFFSGEGDPCAISPEAFGDAVNFMRSVGYTNVDGKLYEGMRHEILNEKDRQLVYEDILEFIRS